MQNFIEIMHPSSLSQLLYGYSISMRLPDVLLIGKRQKTLAMIVRYLQKWRPHTYHILEVY